MDSMAIFRYGGTTKVLLVALSLSSLKLSAKRCANSALLPECDALQMPRQVAKALAERFSPASSTRRRLKVDGVRKKHCSHTSAMIIALSSPASAKSYSRVTMEVTTFTV